MNRIVLIAAIAALLASFPATAQKSLKEAMEEVRAPEASIKALAAGDAQRALLEQFAGSWEGQLTLHLHGDPPPQVKARETVEAKWVMNGFYLETEIRQTFLPEGVDPGFTYRILTGYNPALKRFFRLFLSNRDPREIVMSGSYDPATRTWTFEGTETSAVTGDGYTRKEIYRSLEDGKMAFELSYIFQDGSGLKVGDGVYTRKKK